MEGRLGSPEDCIEEGVDSHLSRFSLLLLRRMWELRPWMAQTVTRKLCHSVPLNCERHPGNTRAKRAKAPMRTMPHLKSPPGVLSGPWAQQPTPSPVALRQKFHIADTANLKHHVVGAYPLSRRAVMSRQLLLCWFGTGAAVVRRCSCCASNALPRRPLLPSNVAAQGCKMIMQRTM
jgi:hypothetical protein